MVERDAGAKPYWTLYAMLQNFLSIMKTMGERLEAFRQRVSWPVRQTICHKMIKALATTESLVMDGREDTGEIFTKKGHRNLYRPNGVEEKTSFR